MKEYNLEKWIWTESDFEQMGWHDSTIYGIKLAENLMLDIDYIFQWNQPEIEGLPYTFFIASCTLIFDEPHGLGFELIQSFDNKWIKIEDIEKGAIGNGFRWTIITQQGDISFTSPTFRQIVRQQPSFQFFQAVPYDERGGISFDLVPGSEKKERLKESVLQRKQKELKDYELAKKRREYRNQLDSLKQEKESGLIDLKDYLKKKAELKNNIDSLTYFLRDSSFAHW